MVIEVAVSSDGAESALWAAVFARRLIHAHTAQHQEKTNVDLQ